MRVSPFRAYKMYLGVKMHFGERDYDYFRYGLPNANQDKFNAKSDRWRFEKLSEQDDLQFYLASNFVRRPNLWAGELIGEEAYETYIESTRVVQSFEYEMTKAIAALPEQTIAENFLPLDNGWSPLMKLAAFGTIPLEVAAELGRSLRLFEIWDVLLKDPTLIMFTSSLRKYSYFIPSSDSTKKIVEKRFMMTKEDTLAL